LKIQKGQSESAYQRIDNTMAKRSTKLIYKTKGRVTRVPLKTMVISGGSVDPAPLVAPVVLI
jgi:hypothetical protein